MSRLDIFVDGTPKPKGSVEALINPHTGRAFIRHGGSKKRAKLLKEWAKNIQDVAAVAWFNKAHIFRPVCIECTFTFERPKSHYRTGKFSHLLKKDAPKYVALKKAHDNDKLERAVWDALSGVVYDDDGRIAVNKATALYGDRPGVRIVVEEL